MVRSRLLSSQALSWTQRSGLDRRSQHPYDWRLLAYGMPPARPVDASVGCSGSDRDFDKMSVSAIAGAHRQCAASRV